jgi:hypothetical protein
VNGQPGLVGPLPTLRLASPLRFPHWVMSSDSGVSPVDGFIEAELVREQWRGANVVQTRVIRLRPRPVL